MPDLLSGGGKNLLGGGGATTRSQSLPRPKKKKRDRGFGGFLGNLGGDIKALAGVPAGLIQMGGMVRNEIMEGPQPIWTKESRQEIKAARPFLPDKEGGIFSWVWPALPGTRGGPKESLHRINEHPLAPVLDIATFATVGVGATARAARIAAPTSRIAEASRPQSIVLRAPRNAKGIKKGEDVELKASGNYINPLRQKRIQGTHAAIRKLGLEPRRWERHNRIRVSRQMAHIENTWLAFMAAGKTLTEAGPERAAAQTRILQHMHRELKNAAHEVDELPGGYEYVRLEGGPEMFRAKAGHSFVRTKKGGNSWREVPDPARSEVVEKILHTTQEGAFIVRGNTARLVRVPPKDKAKGFPEATSGGGGGPKVTRYEDGSVKVTGGHVVGEGKVGAPLKAPKGKAWAKTGEAKWKLVDEKPLGRDTLLSDKGHILERHGKVIKMRRSNVTLGKDMTPDQFENELRSGFVRQAFTTTDAKQAIRGPNGKPIAVPKRLIDDFIGEAGGSHRALTTMLSKPDRIWRAFVLAVPRYMVNNMVGNTAMFMLNHPTAARKYWEAQKIVRGHHKAGKALERASAGHGVRWMDELFGHMYGHGFVEQVPEFAVKGKLGKVANIERRWYDKVNQWTEERYRVASVLHRVRRDPEVQAMQKQGLSEYDAVMAKARGDGQWVNQVSDEVDDIFGQYRYMNNLEKGVRAVVPFYGWSRAITRSTMNTFKDRPGRFYGLYLAGEQGIEDTERKLGEIPRFMQGAIALGGDGDREQILMTGGLNPWNTPVELAEGGIALAGGPGRPGETLGSQLGPLGSTGVESLTGTRMLTGEPHGKSLPGLLAENFGVSPDKPGIPQYRLFEALRKEDQPGTWRDSRGRTGTRLFDPSKMNEFMNVMGLPLRDMSRKAARKRKREEDAY